MTVTIHAGHWDGTDFAFLMDGARTLGPKLDNEAEAVAFLSHLTANHLDPLLLSNADLEIHLRAFRRMQKLSSKEQNHG